MVKVIEIAPVTAKSIALAIAAAQGERLAAGVCLLHGHPRCERCCKVCHQLRAAHSDGCPEQER